jgi:hypothetical protein
MDEHTNEKLPKDVHELLLSGREEDGKPGIDDAVVDARRPKREKFFTVPVIVVIIVALLTAGGIGYIYSDDILSEQFEAMLAGELGKYKEQLRKAREDKIREIENITGNKYGTLTLYYSPRESEVTITEYRYTQECTSATDDDSLLACLKTKLDYAQKPVIKDIDNPSKHIDRAKKEFVEQIPLNDIPIQEASDDRKTMYRYEYEILIASEGYHPRQFFITGERDRGRTEDREWETLFWDQKGPGVFMADFRGADLMPKPETAKENFKQAMLQIECIRREVEAKEKEGRKIANETDLYTEILNRNGFRTFEEFNAIDVELRKEEAWYAEVMAEVGKVVCEQR